MRLLPTVKWVGVSLLWVGVFLLALALAGTALVEFVGWNWLRPPISRLVAEKTGRPLRIDGDLKLSLGWPLLRVSAAGLSFGNPAWARHESMVTADAVEFTIDLRPLFHRRVMLDEVALRQASVFLERNAEGRKNWLLDRQQKDESASVGIGRLTLEKGRLAYDEAWQKTGIQAEISTGGAAGGDVAFNVRGEYKGLPLAANGSGGPVLALRDESRPYPFRIDATIGRTRLQAEGSITGLSRFSAADIRVAVLRGDSLAQLFPLLGIALPETRPYRTAGHLTHEANFWRYEGFSARLGSSDFSGTLQVDSGGKRPFLHGELVFRQLNLADLGPTIGAADKPPARRHPRVLPDEPFRTERWDSVDADIRLTAGNIVRARELPIEHLTTHLQMRDSLLSLDPLEFGVAGGKLGGAIRLDGRRDPIRAQVKLRAKNIVLGKLLPTVKLNQASLGRIDGELDLAGSGNSVASMLASADGRFGLVVAGGRISKLMMEMAGLHLLEIVTLKVAGDKVIDIRCGIADFRVRKGVMQADTLLFDTAITNVGGSGSVDFGRERLDLTLVPKTKKTSLVALHSPIHLRGSFAAPAVELETGRIAARSLGALALGIANPLLALVPLVETGPGMDSDCGRLIDAARQPKPPASVR